jgi:hypothetical protein
MGVDDFTQFGKDHDASNWFSIAFSLVVWPSVLSAIVYYWSKRKIQEIPHFVVSPAPGQTTIIDGQNYPAVGFTFAKDTGSVVYIRRVRLRERQKNFPIPPAAVRDLSGGWREIKFGTPPNLKGMRALLYRERVLHTGQTAYTSIAVSQAMDNAFYSYRPGWFRRLFRILFRLFRCPKYFVLEYTAMVGDRKILCCNRSLTTACPTSAIPRI